MDITFNMINVLTVQTEGHNWVLSLGENLCQPSLSRRCQWFPGIYNLLVNFYVSSFFFRTELCPSNILCNGLHGHQLSCQCQGVFPVSGGH